MARKPKTNLIDPAVTPSMDELTKQLAEMREQLNKLTTSTSQTPQNTSPEGNVAWDEYIPVMSLIPYPLNLSTQKFGQGNMKRFTKFGEVKQVLYRDLVDMIDVHSNFVEAGFFYIMNPAVVRQHGLDDIYSRILTKEKMEEVLNTSSENAVSLYETANEKQKDTIVDLLVEKLRTSPSTVDLNVVDRISRLSKRNIIQEAEDAKEILKSMTVEEEKS